MTCFHIYLKSPIALLDNSRNVEIIGYILELQSVDTIFNNKNIGLSVSTQIIN